MLQEFKDFINKGNMVELAVAVIMATFLGAVIAVVVEEILNFIAAVLGFDVNFDSLYIGIRDGRVFYGRILSSLFTFVVVGAVVFLLVRAYNKLQAAAEEDDGPSDEVALLTEIRDALRNR